MVKKKSTKLKSPAGLALILGVIVLALVIIFATQGQTALFISPKLPSAPTLQTAADLIVTDLSWKWAPGLKAFVITVTVKNQGGTDAFGFITGLADTVNINLVTGKSTPIGTCTLTVARGKTGTCVFNYPVPPRLPFGVTATADSDKRIKESNENNNELSLLVTFCGDGLRMIPNSQGVNEECDDGNSLNTDQCTNSCTRTFCGDGIVQNLNWEGLSEECDDSKTVSGDGCSSQCLQEICGNNRIDFDEECDGTDLPRSCQDSGFDTGTLSCDSSCKYDYSQCSGITTNQTPQQP